MGLQVRIRHALGERLTALPARTVDHPVVVGRSAAADVQVPSVSVAPKHCALFVHDGVWVVQDLGGTSGTFVNGKKVAGPTPLNIGDVVTVGAESGAPKLEIDPAGTAEGRTGRAVAGEPAAPPTGAAAAGAAAYASAPAAPIAPSAPVAPYAGYPQAGGYGPMVPPVGGYAAPAAYTAPTVTPAPAAPYYAPAPVPQAEAQGAWHEADASAQGDHVQWDTPGEGGAAPYYPSYRRRRRKQGGGVGTVIGFLLVAGIVAGGIWYVLKVREKPQPMAAAAKTQPATQPAPAVAPAPMPVPPGAYDPTPTVSSKAFGSPGGKPLPVPGPGTTPATAPAVATPSAPPAVTTPPAPATAPAVAVAPRTSTPPVPQDPPADPAPAEDPGTEPAMAAEGSWEQMVELDIVAPDPAIAILKFEDYRRNHPGKQDQKIDEFIDRKLDQIWWDRINQLFKKRDQLTAGMSKIKREIVDETNPEEKKKQLNSYYEQEKELKRTTSTLREEMGYTEDQPPDLSDKSRLEAARAKRDRTKFEVWKKRTHAFLKRSNGKLEWGK
jgi:hypothetical protein